MDSVRYYIALIFSIMMLPSALAWIFVHPFISKWRKVGPVGFYIFVSSFVASGIFLLWLIRSWLLSIEFGFNKYLSIIAIILYITAILMRVMWRRELRPKTLLGVPEIFGRDSSKDLITEGVYSHIRHPRYVEIGMVLIACALFTNYLISYIIAVLYFPIIYIVILLEEKELRDRFGAVYEEYCSRVPRFIPKVRSHSNR